MTQRLMSYPKRSPRRPRWRWFFVYKGRAVPVSWIVVALGCVLAARIYLEIVTGR